MIWLDNAIMKQMFREKEIDEDPVRLRKRLYEKT